MQKGIHDQLTEYRAKKEAERKLQLLTGLLSNPFVRQEGSAATASPGPTYTDHAAPTLWSRLCNRLFLLLPERVRANRLVAMGWPVRLAVFLLLWLYFVYLEWGAVFFIFGVMYLMISSMRGGGQARSGPSAYSVFNPNCERIEGTFTAEEFDKSMRSGLGLA